MSIHQQQYIQKVLSDFGMEPCQTKNTPMSPKQVLNRCPDKEPPDEETKARFATAIGSLMYLMVKTRPDIAFALGTLSRFTSQPKSHHQVALQRLLRYVKIHAIPSHYIPQWPIDWIYGMPTSGASSSLMEPTRVRLRIPTCGCAGFLVN